MTRPNILIFMVDQLNGTLFPDGPAAWLHAPNLRALADDAVRFDTHFTVTTPCGPSRVSLLTGQYAMNHRAVRNGTPLRDDTPNLAREMRAAGRKVLSLGAGQPDFPTPELICEAAIAAISSACRRGSV